MKPQGRHREKIYSEKKKGHAQWMGVKVWLRRRGGGGKEGYAFVACRNS